MVVIFGDNLGIIFQFSHQKHTLWLLIRKASVRQLPQHSNVRATFLVNFVRFIFGHI